MKNTKANLIRIIKKNFPDLGWKSAKYISAGYDHDVIILDEATVFRFPKRGYAKKLLKDEIGLLKILRTQISSDMPVYTLVAEDYSCAGYPMIKGEDLTVKRFKTLSIKKRTELAMRIAGFLSELHATPSPKLKDCHVRERFALSELKQLHKDDKKHLHSSHENFFSEAINLFKQDDVKVLVHGDFSGNHIFLNKSGSLSGVIDFTDRAIHDPAFDFLFLWEFGNKFIESVYLYYTGNKEGILQRSKMFAKASVIWRKVEAAKKKK